MLANYRRGRGHGCPILDTDAQEFLEHLSDDPQADYRDGYEPMGEGRRKRRTVRETMDV